MVARRLAGNEHAEYHADSMAETLNESTKHVEPPTVPSSAPLSAPSSGWSRLVPAILVMAIPVIIAAWWMLDSGPADDGMATDQPAATTPDEPDPWHLIQQPIFPMGHIARIHHTNEFTYFLFRGEDRDRWVATSPTQFKVGDVVQLRVDPRAVKTDFRVKQLGRVFPTLVLVGQVKLIRSASDESNDSA